MDIERKCRSSVEEYKLLSKPAFLVDPLGSESYGVALARETDPSARPDTAWLCIYSRATQKIEMIDLSDSKLNFESTPSTLPEFRKK
ncbi:hypothetical protein [Rhizobium oryzicola]|uniref:RES domain-containing protein n=1 Tax=Rhizobium oryzicola TaxID=1232668 RepID=A0ABT8ST73_9HYPH|nr:hypothetical protein [Rhizobium oryzicola]MDO1581450.1 hypothetical protein [Rhizobium oryzicola]